MINYESFQLDNGLKVIVHEDHSSPMAVLNLLYKVGARDESPDKTGFAHLFEHLMFGGSKHVPSFDEPLQRVGGDNNAFTSNDITNYYITVPSVNLETAFWLESDRMLSLSFDPKVLEVQRSVVIEEFKQRYLNQPYGDIWLKLRPLAYEAHPYQWATIGKDIGHIERAQMDDVKHFFNKFYLPNNAVLVVAGDVTVDQVKQLSEKWFAGIPSGKSIERSLPVEPPQKAYKELEVHADVPVEALYMTFHMPGRAGERYHTVDLLSDILGRGASSRLYHELVEEQHIFNAVSGYVMGSIDPGLLVIQGKLAQGVDPKEGEAAIWKLIDAFKTESLAEKELDKVKNKAISSHVFSEMELLNRAMNLAYAEMLSNVELVNQEVERIDRVSANGVMTAANQILTEQNASVLRYYSK